MLFCLKRIKMTRPRVARTLLRRLRLPPLRLLGAPRRDEADCGSDFEGAGCFLDCIELDGPIHLFSTNLAPRSVLCRDLLLLTCSRYAQSSIDSAFVPVLFCHCSPPTLAFSQLHELVRGFIHSRGMFSNPFLFVIEAESVAMSLHLPAPTLSLCLSRYTHICIARTRFTQRLHLNALCNLCGFFSPSAVLFHTPHVRFFPPLLFTI